MFDAYVLLWEGDILIVYGLAGASLYFARNSSAKRLNISAVVLIVLMSAFYGLISFGLEFAREASHAVEQAGPEVDIGTDSRVAVARAHLRKLACL